MNKESVQQNGVSVETIAQIYDSIAKQPFKLPDVRLSITVYSGLSWRELEKIQTGRFLQLVIHIFYRSSRGWGVVD